MNSTPTQSPAPGQMLVAPRGDVLEFRLESGEQQAGRAFLRTNLGRGHVRLEEIVREVELGEAPRKADWRDLPMVEQSPGVFSISVNLDEVGRFEAKTYFEPEGGGKLVWPAGDDVVIKVQPADTVCANSIYCAFVRQFGEGKSLAEEPELPDGVAELDEAGYAVIPPSGKFRDLIKQLDFIIGELGFRIVQVLPVFPVPSTYARMGRFGSPFAALDFMAADPALAEFDRRTTPLDQFRELADEIHARRAKLFIDIPINHTGWASWLQTHHPEWFVRDGHEHFQSPGAWGVTWEDLSELNYEQKELWKYIADVFLFWCREGVDGFRCDAGYMVPVPVWRYIVAKVRREFPDTIFFLEGLGGPLQTVEALLDRANIDWAYSEIFQTEGRDGLKWKLGEWTAGSLRRGLEIHFAETHDNNRLAGRGEAYARLRVALAAMASIDGGWGITAGVEWYARGKVLVHGAVPLNWGAGRNQVDWISRINGILSTHPAFAHGATVEVVGVGDGEQFGILRRNRDGEVLVLVNLDLGHTLTASWEDSLFPHADCVDLLGGEATAAGFAELAPGQVRCLTTGVEFPVLPGEGNREPERAETQRIAAAATDVIRWFGGEGDDALCGDPERYCAEAAGLEFCPMARWSWPDDARRAVVVPVGWGVIVSAPSRFHVTLGHGGRVVTRVESLPRAGGGEFALLKPETPGTYGIELTVFGSEMIERQQGELFVSPALEAVDVRLEGGRDHYALSTNGRGAMSYVCGAWGQIRSQYDALLAANLHDSYPIDRRVLLARCRAWIVYRDYSCELNGNCQVGFRKSGERSVEWRFEVPVGGGQRIGLTARVPIAGR